MSFKAHLEYIFHITCDQCKCYFSYAVMEKKFQIERGQMYCPRCGVKGSTKLEKEI